MSQLSLPVICLVTDRRLADGSLTQAILRAVEGGVNLVQLREKDLPPDQLLRLAQEVRVALEGRAPLVVNDRLDVALAAGVDGVHLPGQGLPTPAARGLLGQRLLGRSVHGVEEAAKAGRDGADYVLLGTIFPSRSKPGYAGAGPDLVRQARATCAAPLLAIGGMTAENAASVIEAGADGVAVISAILGTADPALAAARLRERVERGWARRPLSPPAVKARGREGERERPALLVPGERGSFVGEGEGRP